MTTESSTQSYEVWEVVGEGAVWVTLTDDRGRDVQRKVGGPGGAKRIRLRRTDRESMEYIPGNPFESGRLRRVDEGAPAEQVAKTDEELLLLLHTSPSLEDELMRETEFNVRRLHALAKAEGASEVTVQQLFILNRVIQRRWPQPEPPADQLAAANER